VADTFAFSPSRGQQPPFERSNRLVNDLRPGISDLLFILDTTCPYGQQLFGCVESQTLEEFINIGTGSIAIWSPSRVPPIRIPAEPRSNVTSLPQFRRQREFCFVYNNSATGTYKVAGIRRCGGHHWLLLRHDEGDFRVDTERRGLACIRSL